MSKEIKKEPEYDEPDAKVTLTDLGIQDEVDLKPEKIQYEPLDEFDSNYQKSENGFGFDEKEESVVVKIEPDLYEGYFDDNSNNEDEAKRETRAARKSRLSEDTSEQDAKKTKLGPDERGNKESEDEKLIYYVSKYPCVYNYTLESYTPQNREEVWQEIALKLNRDSESCKKHWKTIRDAYSRYNRKIKSGKCYPKNPRSKWRLYRLLSFLDEIPHERARKKVSRNVIEVEVMPDSKDVESDTERDLPDSDKDSIVHVSSKASQSNTSYVQKNRLLANINDKRNYFKKRQESRQMMLKKIMKTEKESDDLVSFATHVKEVLKKLPPVLRIRAKQEMFDVLTKYEIMSVEQTSSVSSDLCAPSNSGM